MKLIAAVAVIVLVFVNIKYISSSETKCKNGEVVCKCGDQSYNVSIPIQMCPVKTKHRRFTIISCKPCNEAYLNPDLCRPFGNCRSCTNGITKCTTCPDGKQGDTCLTNIEDFGKRNIVYPYKIRIPRASEAIDHKKGKMRSQHWDPKDKAPEKAKIEDIKDDSEDPEDHDRDDEKHSQDKRDAGENDIDDGHHGGGGGWGGHGGGGGEDGHGGGGGHGGHGGGGGEDSHGGGGGHSGHGGGGGEDSHGGGGGHGGHGGGGGHGGHGGGGGEDSHGGGGGGEDGEGGGGGHGGHHKHRGGGGHGGGGSHSACTSKVPKHALRTNEVKCIVYPSHVNCTQTCVYGFTFHPSSVRHLHCEESEGMFEPHQRFEECHPFVSCTQVLLKHPGAIHCISHLMHKKASCDIKCTADEDHRAYGWRLSHCLLDGSWSPALPFCVEEDHSVELKEAPSKHH